MGRILRLVVMLAALGIVGLTGYAYLGDMTPPVAEVAKPVVLDVD